MMLKFFTGLSPVTLIGLAIAAAAILSFVLAAFHWKHQAADRKEQLAQACQATRLAADRPKLDCKAMPQQIELLGKAIVDLKVGLAHQNAAVNAAVAESDRQKAAAIEVSRKADKAARGAQATSERLAASSRAGERLAKPCEPSKALSEAWR